jgi:hypothetical protein
MRFPPGAESAPSFEERPGARAAQVASGHAGGQPGEVFGRIHVRGGRQHLEGQSQLPAAVEGRGQDPLGAPLDPFEQPPGDGAGAERDQVIAAVLGRTQDHLRPLLERLEGAVDDLDRQGGMVAPESRHGGGLLPRF